MSAGATTTRPHPLVAVVSRVPIISEALAAALESIAEVRQFPAGRGDTAGLLRWLRPDAIVVDTEEEAEEAASFAKASRSPVVHISLRDQRLRVLRDGTWEEPEADGSSPETIRNILVSGIYGRREQS